MGTRLEGHEQAVIERLYKWVSDISLKYGIWLFKTYTWIVATGYFLFYPPSLKNSLRFYRVLFPEKQLFFHLSCAWKQYHNFTTIFLDRFLLEQSGEIGITYSGWEHITSAARARSGGIILMSHMGNWEMAAHIMKKKNLNTPLLLFMGSKQKEQIENIQKQRLEGSGVKVIGVANDKPSSFALIEAIDFLKKGGMVSITGDRLWHSKQRAVTLPFLGCKVDLPKTPYIFSLLSGAPIFVFFAFRTDEGCYRLTSSAPIHVKAVSRAAREGAIEKVAGQYASMLEQAVRKHPHQWYHFSSYFNNPSKH